MSSYRKNIGTEGLITASLTAIAMSVAALLLFKGETPATPPGLAFPAPEHWFSKYPSEWIVNTVLIFAAAFSMLMCNRKFNFVQGNGMVFPMALLVLTASNPYISSHLCTSTLLLAANTLCIRILFITYNKNNPTQDYFIIGSVLSLGVMTQYSFMAMIPVYIISGIIIKSLHFKELAAYITGLLAPFWILMGLGVISPTDLTLPAITTIFTASPPTENRFIMLMTIGLAVMICALISLNNAVSLYSGNSRVRKFNATFNVIGCACLVCGVIDFGNADSYLGTLCMWMALQTGISFSNSGIRSPKTLLVILTIIYLSPFIFILANQ